MMFGQSAGGARVLPRVFLGLVLLLTSLATPRTALGQGASAEKDLPALPLSVAVAADHGKPVVSQAWLNKRVIEAERLLSPHGVHVRLLRQRPLESTFAACGRYWNHTKQIEKPL